MTEDVLIPRITDQGRTLMQMAARIAAGMAANPANVGLSAANIAVDSWDVAKCLYQLATMHKDRSYRDAGKPRGEGAQCTATL